MIKQELKEFCASVATNAGRDVLLPSSLYAFLHEDVEDFRSMEARERGSRLMQEFSLKAQAIVPESMRGFRGRALCLRGLCGHCNIYLDGARVGEWHSPPAVLYIAMPAEKDTFSLEIRFPERDTPMDVGLFGGAEMIAFSADLITDVYTEQAHKNEKCEFFVRVKTLCGLVGVEMVATLYSPSGEIHYLGLVNGEGRIALPAVQRFRPKGTGIVGLYRLVVTLYYEGQPADSFETTVGFRKITLSKEGDSIPFEMLVDDAPYFIKGAKISAHPAEMEAESISAFTRALPSFVKMGGNAVYATGECGLLPEHVYALCDRRGLFVVQQLPKPWSETELSDYFAELKITIGALINHPSLAFLVLPEGISAGSEIGRAIKGFFAFTFPYLGVRAAHLPGLADIASVSSMPGPVAVRRYLPMEARRIFSYAMESAQSSPQEMISMLNAAAERFPYGASLEDVCYVTSLASSMAAEGSLAKFIDQSAVAGFWGGTLFEGGVSVRPSLMDCVLERKALYFELRKAFSPVFLYVAAQNEAVSVTLASTEEKELHVVTHLMDNANHSIGEWEDDCSVSCGSPFVLRKNLPDVKGHEREYYVWVCVYEGEQLLCEKTGLFVPEKHFRFLYPAVQCEIKGSGRSYELAITASAYVRALRLSFSKMAATFEKNYFDIVSDSKILVSVETDEVTTARLLEAQLRMRSLYDIGRICEQDLLDEKDFD